MTDPLEFFINVIKKDAEKYPELYPPLHEVLQYVLDYYQDMGYEDVEALEDMSEVEAVIRVRDLMGIYVKATKEEIKKWRETLYYIVDDLSIYHQDLAPRRNASFQTLVDSYCFWVTEYNDGYMGTVEQVFDSRLKWYLAEEVYSI